MVHNQIQVIKRLRHILSDSTKAQIYNAFIMLHFNVTVARMWHNTVNSKSKLKDLCSNSWYKGPTIFFPLI